MRIVLATLVFAAVVLGLSTRHSDAADPVWKPIWSGPTEKIGPYWAFVRLDATKDRTDLLANLSLGVGSTTDISTGDVQIELRAGKTKLDCKLDSIGYLETKAITAATAARCGNAAKAVPTELVVTVKGVAHSYAIKL